MNKIIYQIGFILFKLTIAAVGFGFWFCVFSWFGFPVAGLVVGTVVTSFLLLVMNAKRTTCDNASTPHAGKHADEQRRLERYMRLNEHHY